jgi:hypothetical protein
VRSWPHIGPRVWADARRGCRRLQAVVAGPGRRPSPCRP